LVVNYPIGCLYQIQTFWQVNRYEFRPQQNIVSAPILIFKSYVYFNNMKLNTFLAHVHKINLVGMDFTEQNYSQYYHLQFLMFYHLEDDWQFYKQHL
jgi:hypothetical protein